MKDHIKGKIFWFEKWTCGNSILKKMKRKLVWHVFFNVHLLVHQRRNVGGEVEGFCSLLRSLCPSVLRSGAATGDPASCEDS